MNISNVNEKDPLLREIWATGYTHVIKDMINWKMKLINKPKGYLKVICIHELRRVASQLTFMTGLTYGGGTHTWITEKDGSADKFRKLIENTNE